MNWMAKIKKTNSKTECVFSFSVSLSILTLGTNFKKSKNIFLLSYFLIVYTLVTILFLKKK